jgi:hypothetical protein
MRPKFVFAILLVAVFAVGAIVFFKKNSSAPIPVPSAPAASVAAVPEPAPTPAPVVVKKTLTPEERQAAIDAEKDKLSEWQMNDDSQSLSNILGGLISPEKEIREAAIEATKQFNSTNAIPVLKALAANTDDAEEKSELLEAADYLATPTLDLTARIPHSGPITPAQIQAIDNSKAEAEAHRQETLQKLNSGQIRNPVQSSHGAQSSQNQNTQPPPQ